MKEDELGNHPLLALHALRQLPLIRQDAEEIGRHVEDPTLAVFRRAGIEADLARPRDPLAPLQREHLAVDAPAGYIREGDDGTHELRQLGKDGQYWSGSKKPARTLSSRNSGR